MASDASPPLPPPTHGVTKQKQPTGPSKLACLPSLVQHSTGSGDWIPEEPTSPSFSFHPFLSPTHTLCYFNNQRRILNRLLVCRGKF